MTTENVNEKPPDCKSMPPRWDSPEMRSPFGLEENDVDRRDAWLMRAGLTMPAWCRNDPRLDPAAMALVSVLDTLADDGGLVMATPATIAKLLRLLPSEVPMRIDEALSRLFDVGILEHAAGGYLLVREGYPQDDEPEEWSDEALAEWARGLPPEDRKVASATLAIVIANLSGGGL